MCLFCDMINGKIPVTKVYEDDFIIAIDDINPQAPVHTLVIPKYHKENVLSLEDKDDKLLVNVFEAIKKVAKLKNIEQSGFRTVVNSGKQSGQEIDHIHFHILGGRPMTWPPG